MSTAITPRNIISAVVAIAFTVAIHGGWLTGMDRDAIATAPHSAQA